MNTLSRPLAVLVGVDVLVAIGDHTFELALDPAQAAKIQSNAAILTGDPAR